MIEITHALDLRFDHSVFTNTKDGLIVDAIEKVYQMDSTISGIDIVIRRGKTVHRRQLGPESIIIKLYAEDVLKFYVKDATYTNEIYKGIVNIRWFHFVNVHGINQLCLVM
jgi:hypothetical protein